MLNFQYFCGHVIRSFLQVTWIFNWFVKWPRSTDQGEDPGGFVSLLSLHVSMFYKTVFHFLVIFNIFWNMNMVSRELNGVNLIGLQWLHHCLTISPSHFRFHPWKVPKMAKSRAKKWCFCNVRWFLGTFSTWKTKFWACCITNYIISNLEWTYQGLSEINWYLGPYFYVFLTD